MADSNKVLTDKVNRLIADLALAKSDLVSVNKALSAEKQRGSKLIAILQKLADKGIADQQVVNSLKELV